MSSERYFSITLFKYAE